MYNNIWYVNANWDKQEISFSEVFRLQGTKAVLKSTKKLSHFLHIFLWLDYVMIYGLQSSSTTQF